MGKFKDTTGREWQLRLTYGLAKKIREKTEIPILLVFSGDGIVNWKGDDLIRNPEKFVEALWLFIEKQAGEKRVSRDEFEEAFDEATYEAAADAFWVAVSSFSHRPGVTREILAPVGKTNRPSELTTSTNA